MSNYDVNALIKSVKNTINSNTRTFDLNIIKNLLDQGLYSEVKTVLASGSIYYSIDKLKFFQQMNDLGYHPDTLVEKLGDFAEKMIIDDLKTPEKIIGYQNLAIDFSKFSLTSFNTNLLKSGITYLSILNDLGFNLKGIELSAEKVQELTNHYFSQFVKENLDKETEAELNLKSIAGLTAIRDFITPISKENFKHLQIKNFAAHLLSCIENSNFMLAPYNLKENKHLGDIFDTERPLSYLAPCNIPTDKLTAGLQALIKKGQEVFESEYQVVYKDDLAQNLYNPQSDHEVSIIETINSYTADSVNYS